MFQVTPSSQPTLHASLYRQIPSVTIKEPIHQLNFMALTKKSKYESMNKNFSSYSFPDLKDDSVSYL